MLTDTPFLFSKRGANMQHLSGLRCDDGVAAPAHWTRERLDSWKEVAQFFRREVRTVQLWEKNEGLPVRRQLHKKLGSVYAYRRELEEWWIARSAINTGYRPAPEGPCSNRRRVERVQEYTDSDLPRILFLPIEVTHSAHERGLVRQNVERFAEGLREDLVIELRRLSLNPIFLPGKTVSFPETSSLAFMKNMAKEFAASFVVTGSVRYSGNQARVSLQLIRGQDSTCCWSERYQLALESMFDGQSELAVRVSQAIAQESRQRVKVRKQDYGTSHPPAYHACQMGFYFWSQRSKSALMKALGYFQDAITLDPKCADAYAGLADTYVSLSYNYLLPSQNAAVLAKAAVEEALRLDPESLQVQNSFINLLINCTWDWAAAERKSLELIDSGAMDVRTLQLYSTLMNSQGRHDEAISLALHGHRLEPLSDWINGQVALSYFYAGDYRNTLSFARHTIELQPQFMMGHALLGRTEIERGNWDQAILALDRGLELSKHSPCILALLAYAHASAGDVAKASSILLELEECRSSDCFPAYDVSAVHAVLNQEGQALQNMHRAYDTRDMKTIFVNQDPRFASLRDTLKFQQIASSISAA
jgi:TolB-like protein